MDILTCVMDLFANGHVVAGANRSPRRLPLFPQIDDRRYRPIVTPPAGDQRSQNAAPTPLVKPASLPSLQMADNGRRRRRKKRRKGWATGSSTSDADAEISDATSADFTQ